MIYNTVLLLFVGAPQSRSTLPLRADLEGNWGTWHVRGGKSSARVTVALSDETEPSTLRVAEIGAWCVNGLSFARVVVLPNVSSPSERVSARPKYNIKPFVVLGQGSLMALRNPVKSFHRVLPTFVLILPHKIVKVAYSSYVSVAAPSRKKQKSSLDFLSENRP